MLGKRSCVSATQDVIPNQTLQKMLFNDMKILAIGFPSNYVLCGVADRIHKKWKCTK